VEASLANGLRGTSEMTSKASALDGSKPLKIRRGRVESVDLYEIKDSELDLLEKGSPAELQLNFSIFLFSTAFAAISSLATANFENTKVESIFTMVSVVGVLGGIYLALSWWKTRITIKELCQKIRERIPPELISQATEAHDDEAQDIESDPDEAPPPKG
jgi:hypothetical protein